MTIEELQAQCNQPSLEIHRLNAQVEKLRQERMFYRMLHAVDSHSDYDPSPILVLRVRTYNYFWKAGVTAEVIHYDYRYGVRMRGPDGDRYFTIPAFREGFEEL